MAFTGSSLYEVADNLGASHIKTVVKQPGVISVLRITAYYPERRTRHSVATLAERHQNRRDMEIVYEGFYGHKPVKLTVAKEAYDNLLNVLLQNKFTKLDDQPDISYKDHSLWLIQQAYGTYLKNLILSPDVPVLPYSAIANAIDDYLPEAIREIPLT